MAIEFEQRRVSLIPSNSLNTARANLSLPDIGGQLQSIGKKLSVRGSEQQAEKEFAEAQTAASTFVGLDEAGNYNLWPERTFQTQQARNAYDDIIVQNYTASFDADLSRQLTSIQAEANVKPEDKARRMNEALTARLAAVDKAAPRIVGNLRARGTAEVDQRMTNVFSADAERQVKLQIITLKQNIEDATKKGVAAASIGVLNTQHSDDLNKAYDKLVEIGEMPQNVAAAGKVLAQDAIYSAGTAQRLANFLIQGDVSPQDVKAWSIAIETGGEVDLKIESQPDEFGRKRPMATFNSREFVEKVQTPELRGQIAVDLRKAADERSQLLSSMAQGMAYSNHMQAIQGTMNPILEAYRDDFNDDVGSRLVDKGLDDPETQRYILGGIAVAKHMPKSMTRALRGIIAQGDPNEIKKAVAMFQFIKTMKDDGGNHIGDLIINSMDDEDVVFLNSVANVYDLGYSTDVLQMGIRKMNDPSNKVSFDDKVGAYRDLGENKFFSKDMRAILADKIVAVGDGPAAIPLEAEEMFKDVYSFNMTLHGNPQQAFDAAADIVSKRFVSSRIFLNGSAKAQIGQLSNPAGYKVENTNILGLDASGSEFEWLNKDFAGTIAANKFYDPSGSEGQQSYSFDMAQVIDSLGDSFFLQPTDTNTATPEFHIWYKDQRGKIRQQFVRGADGKAMPFIYAPFNNHALANAKGINELEKQSVTSGEEAQIRALRKRMLLQNSARTGRATPYYVQDEDLFMSWLKKQPAEVQQKYTIDSGTIATRAANEIRKLNERAFGPEGSSPDPADPALPTDQEGSLDPRILLEPKKSGFEIAKQAVMTVEKVLPDNNNGAFMLRIATQESDFGQEPGTFRARGDKGLMQVSTNAAFIEVKRRVGNGTGVVYDAAQKLRQELGIDIASMTEDDLDKPLVNVAFARLYLMGIQEPIPTDLNQQASYWKRHYNTVMGAGREIQFVANSVKVPGVQVASLDPNAGMPDLDAAGEGQVVASDTGKANPAGAF